MQTLLQANIFFFITSLAVIFITIGIIVLFFKIGKLVSSLKKLTDKLQSMTDYATDEAESLVEDIKESFIFRLFFPKSKKSKAVKRSKNI
jgi:hypothetical protein